VTTPVRPVPDAGEGGEAALAAAAEGTMKITAAEEFSGLSKRELYRRMEAGELAYSQVTPRKRLISRVSLIALLARTMRV